MVGVTLGRTIAWQLTRAVSPRTIVRATPQEASGGWSLRYSFTHGLDDGIPPGPWAVNLADDQGRFHLLAFDLDAHSPEAAPQAHRDAAVLSQLLADLRIRNVQTASAGTDTGGRHIWVALTQPIPAAIAADLAHRLAILFPSLDKAPLCNPVSGCVRPPGAPHRAGGSATLLAGELEWLSHATTTPEHVAALLDVLDARLEQLPAVMAADVQVLARLPRDAAGHPYLTGERRALSEATRAALATDWTPERDASALLWTILLGCAAARWQLADVKTLLRSPGLEHARTTRQPGSRRRTRRPATGVESTGALLARQWRRACAHVARDPRRPDEGAEWTHRAGAVVASVAALQESADATPGRWTSGRGPAARRVLDALCLWALEGLKTTLDASVRLLGETATLSHEGARAGLHALAEWGLIKQATPAIGARAASWTLVIHSTSDTSLPHAVPRGAPRIPSSWNLARAALLTRLEFLRHDAWTGRGVGLAAGNLSANPKMESAAAVKRLNQHGLLDKVSAGEGDQSFSSRLDAWAKHYKVLGTIERRIQRHTVERMQYHWWLEELQRLRDRHRPPTGRSQGRYPRRPDHRPNHAAASRICVDAAAA